MICKKISTSQLLLMIKAVRYLKKISHIAIYPIRSFVLSRASLIVLQVSKRSNIAQTLPLRNSCPVLTTWLGVIFAPKV